MLVASEEVEEGEPGHGAESEPHRDADRDKASHANRDLSIMMLLREFLFCAALALVTYGALHSSPPKISRHPPAVRFFPADSPVRDWHRGQLSAALARAAREDVSLVMYYAPWDAECQHVRGEFDTAARLMGDQVHFAAINCWNPGSECRQQHDKIPSWPVIMAYTINSKGVLYNGPRDAPSLLRFAELISRPLERVSSMADLVSLLSVCDAVALAVTPLTDGDGYYATWYSAALRWRQADPLSHLCLAVATHHEPEPRLRLILYNDTKDFDGGGGGWTESSIVQWLERSARGAAARVSPAWTKSLQLSTTLGATALLLFTPLEPLFTQHPVYDLLREVAMEYHECTGSEWTRQLIRLQQTRRRLYTHRELLAPCKHHNYTRLLYDKIISNAKTPWHNATLKKSSKSSLYSMLLKHNFVRVSAGTKADTVLIGRSEDSDVNHLWTEEKEYRCEDNIPKLKNERFGTSMLSEDALSGAGLLAREWRARCRLMEFATGRAPVPSEPRVSNYTPIHGLACRTNASLNFVAMDSTRNHHFAESLGIDIMKRADRTAVVILDSKSESQYVLDSPITESSLREFVQNFTAGTLRRRLRSAVPSPASGSPSPASAAPSPASAAATLRVEELTTRTFGRFVRSKGETSVVLVCGGACPSHASRAALSAARLLRRHSLGVAVARIDAHAHDLPWRYTVHALPTLLVFPSHGREESAAYPHGERVTTEGVVALVARTLGAPTELRLQLALCNHAQYTEGRRQCLVEVRRHATRLVERALRCRRRRSLRTHTRALVRRLAALQELVWALHEMHESYLSPGDHRQDKLLACLDRLDTAWRAIDNDTIDNDTIDKHGIDKHGGKHSQS